MAATPRWLNSILEEHFEEIQMLGEMRQTAVRDPDYVDESLRELDERIEAHIDGLIISREHAQAMILEGLAGGEPSVVFAAVLVLLRYDDTSLAAAIVDALAEAEEDEVLSAFAAALCLAPVRSIETELMALALQTSRPVAAVAAEGLAFHGRLDPHEPRIAEWVLDDSPIVRQRGWRIVSYVGR